MIIITYAGKLSYYGQWLKKYTIYQDMMRGWIARNYKNIIPTERNYMTKLEAQKTLEKMRKAGNTDAKIVMIGCDSKGIKYAIKTGYEKYIK